MVAFLTENVADVFGVSGTRLAAQNGKPFFLPDAQTVLHYSQKH